MPCSPKDNSINIGALPGINIPGFGFPFSSAQVPFPEFDLPTDLINDLLGLIQKLGALFPSGLFKPSFDFGIGNVLDVIANLLSQVAPYLSLYNLIMPVLNLIICIIEILCAIPDPWAIASKLKKLFAECLPPFINIFPWLALIAMIIALLLLLLALLEYIIATIIAIIAELLKNLILLARGLALQDDDVALAIAQKIAMLLCFIENLMAIFIAIAAIFAVITSLMQMGGLTVCSDEDTDQYACCNAENCPPFIKDNPTGLTSTLGRMVYHREYTSDVAAILGIGPGLLTAPPLREERWQFLNEAAIPQTYPFSDIITPINDKIFFPDIEYDDETAIKRSPYLVDLRLFIDPSTWVVDVGGPRFMRITDCIVVRKPYLGIINFLGVRVTAIPTNMTGTLNLEGGKVTEDDGTPYLIGGVQGTLNTLIHNAPVVSIAGLPLAEDATQITTIEYTLKFNHAAMAANNLVTVGCFPGVSVEKAVQNARWTAEGLTSVLMKIGPLPNVLTTQACITTALAKFRKNITAETAAEFQATAETCINTLKNQTLAIYKTAVIAGTSQYSSTFTIDPDVQFVTKSITVTVMLKDPSGTIISTGIPLSVVDDIISKLAATITLGKITDFTYDGTQAFIADITSDAAGTGTISMEFDGKKISTITVGTDLNTPSNIAETILAYEFVDSITTPADRRDATDVANDAGGR